MEEDCVAEFPDFRLNAKRDILRGWHRIFRTKQRLTLPARSVIAEQGKLSRNLYYIERGLVEYTYLDAEGRQNFIEMLGDDCVFPLQPVFANSALTGTFWALGPCTLSVISAEEAYAYLRQDSDLALELLAEFSQICGGHVRQIAMNTGGIVNRVEQVLCLLAEYHLRHIPKGAPLVIELSQADLARISKTTRVTVTKVLSDLRQRGIVKTAYGGLIITDLAALRRTAYESI